MSICPKSVMQKIEKLGHAADRRGILHRPLLNKELDERSKGTQNEAAQTKRKYQNSKIKTKEMLFLLGEREDAHGNTEDAPDGR